MRRHSILFKETDNRWMEELSHVICVMNFKPASFQASPVAIAKGTKMWIVSTSVYFAVFFAAALSAAAVAFVDVSSMYEFANVIGMLTFDASRLPLVHSDVPYQPLASRPR